MGFSITVQDSINSRPVHQIFNLYLASETLTARELITRRVVEECAQDSVIKSFFQSHVEKNLNKKKQTKENILEKNTKEAIFAFKRNRFILFVDEHQVTELEEPIVLTRSSLIEFMLLFPLQGG